ncbi:MAG: cytochrome c maturation protein CcmE [Anaerolineae bacterium]|nr:cytochrome c maturation protein CcmE [Anaerolineae bacterium]
MAELTWQKGTSTGSEKPKNDNKSERLKFAIGGVLILVAIAVLIISGTSNGAQYFVSVDDVVHNAQYVGQTVRVTGAVFGDTIQYNSDAGELSFTIASLPDEYEDLATALHEAVNLDGVTRLPVFIADTAKPDLLEHEAQAILTGTLGEDGVFYATDLLLKCPSRFEENTPGDEIHLQDNV